MSNLGQFSPFKRTYQFMHLQNSAYHLKNKKQVKPMVKTNLNFKRSNRSSKSVKLQNTTRSKSQIKKSQRYNHSNSQIMMPESASQSYGLKQPYRVIHKNEVFQRARSARIDTENKKMVFKLIDADCMVVSRERAARSYQRHRKYSSLIRKYQENGERIVTPVTNLNKISPTIAEYHTSRVQSARQNLKIEGDQLFFSNNYVN